jgi:hypothetical protein
MQRVKLVQRLLNSRRIKRNAVNCLRDPNNIRVMVVTIPKTGTSALAVSFQKAFNGRSAFNNVLHGHSKECINRWLPFLKPHNVNVTDFINYYNYKHPGKKAIVVHSYREPISRLISSYFFNGMHRPYKDPEILKSAIIAYLQQITPIMHLYNEYSSNLGVPIFEACAFNHTLGYGYKETDRCHLIHTRVDKLPHVVKLVKQIDPIQFKNFRIAESNIRKDPLYDMIKKSIVIPEEIISKHFDNEADYMNFYYTKEEIQGIKKTWTHAKDNL